MRALIAIVSCHRNAERRRAQRMTWLAHVRPQDFDYRFFIGRDYSYMATESDVEQLLCGDEYKDLSNKVHAVIRWARENGYTNLFKCDDDTFVHPKRLSQSGFQHHDFTGYMEDWDIYTGKRSVPFVVYPHPRGGSGYWLSLKAMCAAAVIPDLNHQEELAVATALMQNGIVPHHDERYKHIDGHHAQNKAVPTSSWITIHKCDPAKMHQIYDMIGGIGGTKSYERQSGVE